MSNKMSNDARTSLEIRYLLYTFSVTLYSILFPNINCVWEIIAGNVERKKPTTGNKTNSRGNKSCFTFEAVWLLGLLRKSITIIMSVAKRQEVKIKPANRGRLYPNVVCVNTGFTKG